MFQSQIIATEKKTQVGHSPNGGPTTEGISLECPNNSGLSIIGKVAQMFCKDRLFCKDRFSKYLYFLMCF